MKISTLVLIALSPLALVATATAQDDIPRTPSGKPDFSGNYDISSLTPFQRPAEYGERLFLEPEELEALRAREMSIRAGDSAPSDPDREAPEEGGNIGSYNDFWFDRGDDGLAIDGRYRTSILTYPENGRMPERTAAGQEKAARAPRFAWPERDGAWWLETGDTPYDGPENQTLAVRCIFQARASIPVQPLVYNNLKTIVQTDDYLMLYIEWMSWARIIRINAEHKPAVLSTFDGDSVGHWDGDTLVVETTNFLDLPGQPNEGRRVVERFSPLGNDGLLYSFMVEDPDFTDSWGGELPWPRTEQIPYEYACHEGNYAMTATLMGARVREREAREQEAARNE